MWLFTMQCSLAHSWRTDKTLSWYCCVRRRQLIRDNFATMFCSSGKYICSALASWSLSAALVSHAHTQSADESRDCSWRDSRADVVVVVVVVILDTWNMPFCYQLGSARIAGKDNEGWEMCLFPRSQPQRSLRTNIKSLSFHAIDVLVICCFHSVE